MKIWTEQEQMDRELDNMLEYKGETCKTCQWCDYEPNDNTPFFTCGAHLQNFIHTSWCSFHTDKNDPKVKAYNEARMKLIKLK